MVNGTKLLNVAGLSRGKRDGILKAEKIRVVVKVGSMCFKGVWIPLERARILSSQYTICDIISPLLCDNPDEFLTNSFPAGETSNQNFRIQKNTDSVDLSTPYYSEPDYSILLNLNGKRTSNAIDEFYSTPSIQDPVRQLKMAALPCAFQKPLPPADFKYHETFGFTPASTKMEGHGFADEGRSEEFKLEDFAQMSSSLNYPQLTPSFELKALLPFSSTALNSSVQSLPPVQYYEHVATDLILGRFASQKTKS